MLSNLIGLLTTWEKPDELFSWIPLESKGKEGGEHLIKSHRPSGLTVITKINIF